MSSPRTHRGWGPGRPRARAGQAGSRGLGARTARGAALLLAALALTSTSCGGATGDVREAGASPTATTTGDPASPDPSGTTLDVTTATSSDAGGADTPSEDGGDRATDGATPRPSAGDDPYDDPYDDSSDDSSDGERPVGDTWTFAELWDARADLIGREVVVTGRVLFDLVCPPQPEPRDSTCVASAKLVAPTTTHLADTDEVLPLTRDGASISCEAQTSTGLVCQGLEDGRVTTIRGVVRRVSGFGDVIDDATPAA